MIIGQNFRMHIASEAELAQAYDIVYETRALDPDEVGFYRRIVGMVQPYVASGEFLDISCGLGHLVFFAKENGYKAYGIDISSKAIEIARESYPACEFLIGSAENLPFADESFDVITNLGSLEHYLDMEKAIRDSARVLKKEGIVVYMMPNQYFLPTIIRVLFTGKANDKVQPIERFATKLEWAELLEANGLKVELIGKYNIRFRNKGILGHLYNILRYTIPRNLSWHFFYFCRKA
jgi:ubiquinone/menaquinone biosynthesis C-methylase UbiE